MQRDHTVPCIVIAGSAVATLIFLHRRRRQSSESALADALRRLDKAHRAPFSKEREAEYCEAVEAWAIRLRQAVGECSSAALRLGARAQHLERGAIPRKSYPEGRDGYLRWRAASKKRQGERIGELLGDLQDGLGKDCIEKVRALVSKSLPLCPYHGQNGGNNAGGVSHNQAKADAEMQCIEDAACLVFLEQELRDGFSRDKDDGKMITILEKTWKKMSRVAHAFALQIDYEPRMLGCIVEAIGEAENDMCSEQELALPVPRPSQATINVVLETWTAVCEGGMNFGEAWYEELRLDSNFSCDLKVVLNFPVARAANISRAVQMLLDLWQQDGEAIKEYPRFAKLLRVASSLAQTHARLRLKHVDAMRYALVSTMCKLTSQTGVAPEKQCRNAWESFSYAIGAQMAPYLLFSDPTNDFCTAVATALPTPGAGPCAALLVAKGTALLEMALGLVRRKTVDNSIIEIGTLSVEEVADELRKLRQAAIRAGQQDSHAYCGLLAAAIFDTAGGTEGREERQKRREIWMQRCIAVPFDAARSAVRAAHLGHLMQKQVRATAPSVVGDLETGQSLLLAAARCCLMTAEHNVKASKSDQSEAKGQLGELWASLKELQPDLH